MFVFSKKAEKKRASEMEWKKNNRRLRGTLIGERMITLYFRRKERFSEFSRIGQKPSRRSESFWLEL